MCKMTGTRLWINIPVKEDVCVVVCICLLLEAAHTECRSGTERERAFEEGDEKEEDTGGEGEGRRKDEDGRDGGLGKKERRLPCRLAILKSRGLDHPYQMHGLRSQDNKGMERSRSNNQATASPRCPCSLQAADPR